MADNAKTLDEEIKRAMAPHFNYTEPPTVATVKKVNSKSADVKIAQGDESIILRNTPILKSCWGTGTLNLKAGEQVMLIFQGGHISNAYIVGKL